MADTRKRLYITTAYLEIVPLGICVLIIIVLVNKKGCSCKLNPKSNIKQKNEKTKKQNVSKKAKKLSF